MTPPRPTMVYRTTHYGLYRNAAGTLGLWVLGPEGVPRVHLAAVRSLAHGRTWLWNLQRAYNTPGVDVAGKSTAVLRREHGRTGWPVDPQVSS